MRTLFFVLVLCFLAVSVESRVHPTNPISNLANQIERKLHLNPPVVKQLNVTQYLGRWYQVYGDFLTQNTFEKGAVCAIADYGLNANGTISVHNQQRMNTVDGPVKGIYGFASTTNTVGKLTVFLQGTPFPGPYWVLALGPVVNEQYEYAIVSDGLQATLFILTRDVARYYAKYDQQVMAQVQQLGYTNFLNKPLRVTQEGCTYPAPDGEKDAENF